MNLATDGIALVDPCPHADEALAFLNTCQTYHGHVKGASVAMHQSGNSSCWAPEDVLRAPHLWEFALGFTDVAGVYLGQQPLLYSVNAFTTYPISGPMNPDIQEFHRDRDDSRFLALFIYLTNVPTAIHGAHVFKAGTHLGAEDGVAVSISGPAGTAFLADTRGLHMGIRPESKPRTIAWFRWGVSDPPASYLWDHQQPCDRAVLGGRYPEDEAMRSSIRLVVQ